MIIRMWKWDSKKTSACKVFCCIQKFDESNLHVKKKFERPKKEHRKVESNLKWFTRSEEMWQQLWNMFIYLKSKLGMINKFRFFFFVVYKFKVFKYISIELSVSHVNLHLINTDQVFPVVCDILYYIWLIQTTNCNQLPFKFDKAKVHFNTHKNACVFTVPLLLALEKKNGFTVSFTISQIYINTRLSEQAQT